MTAFPQTLKTWRQARRMSQLDLALEAEVSSRHISFLETGRANPSREMIARLGDALQLPLDARNQMLNNAGFASRYPARQWDHEDMSPVRQAVDHMLENHMPYPALTLDRLWKVLRMNRSARVLFGGLGVSEGGSLLDLVLAPLLPQVVENWPEVAHHLAQRLRTESAAQGGVSALEEAAQKLAQTACAPSEPLLPVVPAVLKLGETRIALFSTIAQFGTPEDVMLGDLRIELFFPADDESSAALRRVSEV